jgi:GT2 family glycosyltransferase
MPLLFFLNPDVRVDLRTACRLADLVDGDPRIAGVGPRLGMRNTVKEPNAGGAEKNLLNALVFALAPARAFASRQIWRSEYPTATPTVDVDWVSGACLAFHRDAFIEAGGFPSGHFLYEEDVALGRAIRKRGYRVCVAGCESVSHRVGGSQPDDDYFRRWALGNQRTVRITEPSRPRALLALALICIGLVRRATWRSFLGRSRPHRYLRWSLHYVLAYGTDPPRDGPVLPP